MDWGDTVDTPSDLDICTVYIYILYLNFYLYLHLYLYDIYIYIYINVCAHDVPTFSVSFKRRRITNPTVKMNVKGLNHLVEWLIFMEFGVSSVLSKSILEVPLVLSSLPLLPLLPLLPPPLLLLLLLLLMLIVVVVVVVAR